MRILAALLAACLAAAVPAVAAPAPANTAPVIATIVAVEGKVSVKPAGKEGWVPARVQMNDYAHDHVRTDASSVAALEFAVGGKIGINKASEIELIGPRSAVDSATGTELRLTSGSIWAKMTPQKQAFKITTPSATIGIRGTEFVVDESNGQTEVSVLSGEVGVTDMTNQLTIATPGQVLRILPGKPPIVRLVELAVLRRQLQQRHGPLLQLLERLRTNGPPPRPFGPRRRLQTPEPSAPEPPPQPEAPPVP